MPEKTLLTVGEIAKQTKTPIFNVQALIARRGLKPVARAGRLRIFSEDDLAYIAAELRRIARDRAEPHRPEDFVTV